MGIAQRLQRDVGPHQTVRKCALAMILTESSLAARCRSSMYLSPMPWAPTLHCFPSSPSVLCIYT
jgi:hypothetical protein